MRFFMNLNATDIRILSKSQLMYFKVVGCVVGGVFILGLSLQR